MTNDVLVSIRGIQRLVGAAEQEVQEEPESIEIMTGGKYCLRNGRHYIKYDENYEGFSEPAQNLVKLDDHIFEVRKKGLLDVQMVFEKEKKTISYYKTPYGTMRMGITTTYMKLEEKLDRIMMEVDYALEMNDELVGNCHLEMKIQEKKAVDR